MATYHECKDLPEDMVIEVIYDVWALESETFSLRIAYCPFCGVDLEEVGDAHSD